MVYGRPKTNGFYLKIIIYRGWERNQESAKVVEASEKKKRIM